MKRVAFIALIAGPVLGCGLLDPTAEVTVWLHESGGGLFEQSVVELLDSHDRPIARANPSGSPIRTEVSTGDCGALRVRVWHVWTTDVSFVGLIQSTDRAILADEKLPGCGAYVADVSLREPATATILPARSGAR